MRKVDRFEELNLTEKQQGFLRFFLANISSVTNLDKVILFGSCAKERTHKNSDIDLFVITKREPTTHDEVFIMAQCPPDYESIYYLQSDIIVKSSAAYEKHKNEMGMVQKYVEMDGVDVTGLVQECAG